MGRQGKKNPNTKSEKQQHGPAPAPTPSPPSGSISTWLNSNPGFLTVAGALASLGFFAGSWYMKSGLVTSEEFQKAQNKIDGISERLANIEGRIVPLEQIVYKQKAEASGLQQPQIVPVSRYAPQQPKQITSPPDSAVLYQLTFSIREITADSLTLNMTGTIGGITLGPSGIGIRILRTPGYSLNLRNVFNVKRPSESLTPDLTLTVIENPTPDTTILAFGLKTSSPS